MKYLALVSLISLVTACSSSVPVRTDDLAVKPLDPTSNDAGKPATGDDSSIPVTGDDAGEVAEASTDAGTAAADGDTTTDAATDAPEIIEASTDAGRTIECTAAPSTDNVCSSYGYPHSIMYFCTDGDAGPACPSPYVYIEQPDGVTSWCCTP